MSKSKDSKYLFVPKINDDSEKKQVTVIMSGHSFETSGFLKKVDSVKVTHKYAGGMF